MTCKLQLRGANCRSAHSRGFRDGYAYAQWLGHSHRWENHRSSGFVWLKSVKTISVPSATAIAAISETRVPGIGSGIVVRAAIIRTAVMAAVRVVMKSAAGVKTGITKIALPGSIAPRRAGLDDSENLEQHHQDQRSQDDHDQCFHACSC